MLDSLVSFSSVSREADQHLSCDSVQDSQITARDVIVTDIEEAVNKAVATQSVKHAVDVLLTCSRFRMDSFISLPFVSPSVYFLVHFCLFTCLVWFALNLWARKKTFKAYS